VLRRAATGRVEEGLLGCGYVEADGIRERDHGFNAHDQPQSVGDAVEVLLESWPSRGVSTVLTCCLRRRCG
jgi:hypothetical protein